MPTTHISGLTHEASLPFPDADTVHWLSPEDFFRHARSPEASDPDQQWVWLYRAPWMQVVASRDNETTIAALLDQWRHEQRTILNLRPILGSRLVLINVDQVSAQEIRARLGLEGDRVELSPEPAFAGKDANPSNLSSCAAKLFEWCLPRDWDLFEALEATAWHGQGKPCFRQDITPPDDQTFMDLLQTLRHGLEHASLQARLRTAEQDFKQLQTDQEQTRQDVRQAQAERDEHAKKLARIESKHKELSQENELLLAQLHQVQEELERYYLANQDLIAGLDRSTQTMHRARAAVSRNLPAQQPRQQRSGKLIVSL